MTSENIRVIGLLPSIPLGGMERAAIRLFVALSKRGVEMQVLAERRWALPVQDELDARQLSWSPISRVAGYNVPRTIVELISNLRSYAVTGLELSWAADAFRPSAVIATNATVAYRACHIARRQGTVSVFRVPNPPIIAVSGVRAAFNRMMWRRIAASYDHIVCNSDYTARKVVEVTGRFDKCRVIRNFAPDLTRQIEYAAPELPPNRRRVVFLGQISRQKGLDVLLEAAKVVVGGHADVDFVLAGPTIWKDPYANELRKKVLSAGLKDRFIIFDTVDDVQGLLRQCLVHVCPSVSPGESFPNVILDAKQASVPSVVFPIAGLPEAVKHGEEGVVTKEVSPIALAGALQLLLGDNLMRERMAAAAFRSLERHDEDRLAEQWISLLSGGKAA